MGGSGKDFENSERLKILVKPVIRSLMACEKPISVRTLGRIKKMLLETRQKDIFAM